MKRLSLLLSLLTALHIAGCATSTSVVDDRPPDVAAGDTTSAVTSSDYASVDYAATRSKISDVLKSVDNPYPEEFARSRGQSTGSSSSRQGFRIQLLSTQNRVEAENMLEEYNLWISSQPFEYKAMGYIVFRSPNYRVHIGDFHDREAALQYSRRVKDRFTDAWVVADTIDPAKTPRR